MEPFVQTKSISRRLTYTLIAISTFFVIEIVGLYISGQSFLHGFARLYQINQVNEDLEQVGQIVASVREKIAVANKSGLRSGDRDVFQVAGQNADDLLAEVVNSLEDSQQLRDSFQKIQKSLEELMQILDQATAGDTDPAPKLFVAEQFTLEMTESLRRSQIELNHEANRIFNEVYESRFQVLMVGIALAAILIIFAIWLSLRLSRHFNISMASLLGATEAVSRGNLEYHVPIVKPDEFGRLASSFNMMSRALRQTTVSRDYLEGILESMLDSVIVLDSSGKITRVNQVTGQTFGYLPDELINEPIQKIFSAPFDVFSAGKFQDALGISKNGTTVPLAVSVSRLQKAEGVTTGFVCVLKDITEIKEAESELRDKNVDLANANRELEAFSYSVSHDLRSPLRSVDGFSQALLEDCGDQLSAEGKEHLTRIRAAVQRMGQLIDDLLNLSRITRANINLSEVDLSKIARDIAEELKKESPSRQVDFQIQENVRAYGDPSLLKVAIENLLSNAWKYTSKHAKARIEFGSFNSPDKGEVYFVRDDGAGFNMNYSQKLFGAFQRLHANSEFPGTGIGLATVQRIIHRHGGSIWAESEIEKGATFYFTL